MYIDTINPELIPLLRQYGMRHVYGVEDTVDIIVTDGEYINPTNYGEVFDWIADRFKIYITIEPYYDMANEVIADDYFEWTASRLGGTIHHGNYGTHETWKECADAAIRTTLIEYVHTFGVACDTCGKIHEFLHSDIHKSDEEDENSFVICPNCHTKLYIAD